MIRVVLADDHQLFRQGLRRLLESERDIQVVGEAEDGLEVQRVVQELSPDVVLMDLSMAITDGISATREIVRQWPQVKVVILSMHAEEGHLFQALQAGAAGYILKNTAADQVAAAVRAAMAGGAVVAPSLANKVLTEFRRMASKLGVEDNIGQLTEVELKMLQLVASGLSNKEIANRMCFAESTVKNRLSVTFQKIGVADRTQAAVYAITHGLAPIGQSTESSGVTTPG
ncbi:MAG TPA: response regulator transcription factor [Chloroflexota bacterium]|nr:response regulator transcription factor [Chloroflexota bacterium]